MGTYISNVQTAVLLFPLLSALLSVPYAIYQYRSYGSISLWKTFLVFSFIFYLMCAYFMVILPLPADRSIVVPGAQHPQLVPFRFMRALESGAPLDPTSPASWIAFLRRPDMHGVFQRAAYRTVRRLPALSVSSPLVAGARVGVRAHLVLRGIAGHGAFRHLRASVPAVRRRRPHHQHARRHAWVLGLHSALPLPARPARRGRAVPLRAARRTPRSRAACSRLESIWLPPPLCSGCMASWCRWAVGRERAIRRAGGFAGRHVRYLHGHTRHHARADDRPYGAAAARCAPRWLEARAAGSTSRATAFCSGCFSCYPTG